MLDPTKFEILPDSKIFGLDKGTPIDRYYIERFLEQNKECIHGNILEVGNDVYTRKYSKDIKKSDILNVSPNKKATIIGDLEKGINIPKNQYDCFLMTQTLLCIFDFESAIKNSMQLLKSNGVILLTVPGISQISRYDMDRWGDYWRFTDLSLKKTFDKFNNIKSCDIQTYGNVATSAAFLYGFTVDKMTTEQLNYVDRDYQMTIAAKIVKK